MSYTLPSDVDSRPVAVDGAGTLGRRIASAYAAGGTDVRIFDLSPEQCEAQYGLVPFHVLRESDGFIFKPRLGRDQARVLVGRRSGGGDSRGPGRNVEDLRRPRRPPFRLMDRSGLDVVLNIEEHYASVRSGLSEGPRDLVHKLIDEGRLGVKTGRGFYEYPY